MAYITVNGQTRKINKEELKALAERFIPEQKERYNFVKNVAFFMANIEFETDSDISAEEYYFAACYWYIQDHGYQALYECEDDLEVFSYCGTTLPEQRESFTR